MSDDETESDSVGPDIDLEKIASESSEETADADHDEHADAESDGHGDHHDGHDHHDEPDGRTTAPQSDYSGRQVAIGAIVTAVGIAIAYGVPALLG